jgi:hypothetical protein
LNLFHNPTDVFSCWDFSVQPIASPSGDHFRLAAFVHHRNLKRFCRWCFTIMKFQR